MGFGSSSRLGVSLFEDTHSIGGVSGYSVEELEVIIKAVYRQVFGNAYVMQNERLTVPESQFKRGEISGFRTNTNYNCELEIANCLDSCCIKLFEAKQCCHHKHIKSSNVGYEAVI